MRVYYYMLRPVIWKVSFLLFNFDESSVSYKEKNEILGYMSYGGDMVKDLDKYFNFLDCSNGVSGDSRYFCPSTFND